MLISAPTDTLYSLIENFNDEYVNKLLNLVLSNDGKLLVMDENTIVHKFITDKELNMMSQTTQPQTTQSNVRNDNQLLSNISDETIISFLNTGVDLMNLYSDKNYMSEKGMHFDSQLKGPSTNIYQKNFSGTSNVYSPYLYYNKNKNTQPIITEEPTTTIYETY